MKKVAERGRRTIDGAREAGKDGSNLAERVRNAAQGANAALQEDRTQAQANAISEAKAAAERLAAKQSQVLDLALAHCGPAGSPPPVPDEAPVRVLVTLIDHLHQQAQRCGRLALRAQEITADSGAQRLGHDGGAIGLPVLLDDRGQKAAGRKA
jgi:hypothetical protein